MRIRGARDEDWKKCLALDVSYDTDSAWQMGERRASGEWSVGFTEVRLPRKQEMELPLSPEQRLVAWGRCHSFWVAVESRKVLGYAGIILELERRQARFAELCVGKDVRRQGIAKALLEHVTTWALSKKVEQLVIECPPKAHPMISFALSQGFVMCGFQDNYWLGQEVGLFFCKRIR